MVNKAIEKLEEKNDLYHVAVKWGINFNTALVEFDDTITKGNISRFFSTAYTQVCSEALEDIMPFNPTVLSWQKITLK